MLASAKYNKRRNISLDSGIGGMSGMATTVLVQMDMLLTATPT